MSSDHIKEMMQENPEYVHFKTKIIHIVDTDEYLLHIPKCGGTSIRDGLIFKHWSEGHPRLDYVDRHNHSTAKDLSDIIDITNKKFIVSVRHPIARFLSSYNFLMDIDFREIFKLESAEDYDEDKPSKKLLFLRKRRHHLKKTLGQDGFIDLLVDEEARAETKRRFYSDNEPNHYDWAFMHQKQWTKGIPPNNLRARKIENHTLFKELDIEIQSSKTKLGYNRQIGLDNKQKIYDYFKKDFSHFGYGLSEQWDAHHLQMEKRIEEQRKIREELENNPDTPDWLVKFMSNIKIKKPKQ